MSPAVTQFETMALKQPGESVTMDVVAMPEVASQFGPQYLIQGHGLKGGVQVYCPKETIDRQLDRIGLAAETILGETVTVGRSIKVSANGHPYWNITKASEVGADGDFSRPPARVVAKAPGRPVATSQALKAATTTDFEEMVFGDDAPTQPPTVDEIIAEKQALVHAALKREVLFFINEIFPILQDNQIPVEFDANALIATSFLAMDKRAAL